jgi:hypothetical protein
MIRLMSVNLGEGMDNEAVIKTIVDGEFDIVAFQEIEHHKLETFQHLLANGWFLDFREHLGLASRFPILETELQNRRFHNDWGGIIGRYLLAAPFGEISVFNVHLETPREGVEDVIAERWNGIAGMKKVTEIQEVESMVASRFVQDYKGAIILGDFNMREPNPIYQKYWGSYADAFSQVGRGWGYTKFTDWHGVRIDHCLYDPDYWQAIWAVVGSGFGGDHRQILVTLAAKKTLAEQGVSQRALLEDLYRKIITEERAIVFEGFDTSPGKFTGKPGSGTVLLVERKRDHPYGNALKIQGRRQAEHLSAGITLENWNLDQYPRIRFAYRIPKEAEVGMRVRTQFGDWLCLGGTPLNDCPHTALEEPVGLINDGQWHEVELLLKEQLRSRLAALKYVEQFEFYIHHQPLVTDEFWIDHFRISER